MYDHMLGISSDGGLAIYDIGPTGFRKKEPLENQISFVSTFVFDVDNDGTEEIVACSKNGKLFIYDWHSTQLKLQDWLFR
jgi:hypothetical protein